MKEEDLQQLITRLVERDKQKKFIVANPDAIADLIKQGAQLEEPPEVCLEQAINRILSDRKETIRELGEKLPDPPRRLALPTIESLYDEVIACILFKLNNAAITLSGILVEVALRQFTYACEVGGFVYDVKKWNTFEKKILNDLIAIARRKGLLTDDEEKKLGIFREQIRNSYIHYKIKEITKQVKWEKVERTNLETGEVEKTDIAANENQVIQAQAKPFIDEKQVLEIFEFADEIIKRLFSRTMNYLSKPNKT